MQEKHLLASFASRAVLCGALFGLALMPVAHAQQSSIGPSDASSLAYSSSSALPNDPGTGGSGQAPTLGGPTQTQPQTPTYGQPQTPTYGGHRKYGHQTYSDRWTNADGSSKYALAFGGGMTIPVSQKTSTSTPGYAASCAPISTGLNQQGGDYSGSTPCIPDNTMVQTPDWAIQAGFGRNFNKRLGILAQFEFDRMNVAGPIVDYFINSNPPTASNPQGLLGLDMNTHVLSLTLNPIFNFYQGDHWGAYVIGGGGYYHKATNFTIAVSSGYGYGYGGGASNQNIDTVAGNTGGMDIGFGVTRKFSQYSNAKLFLEARYNYVASTSGAIVGYPENGYSTGYIPVVLGIRW